MADPPVLPPTPETITRKRTIFPDSSQPLPILSRRKRAMTPDSTTMPRKRIRLVPSRLVRRCTSCRKEGDDLRPCMDQCGGAWYCNLKCDGEDYPSHELICRNFKESRRPHVSKKRIIVFPVSSRPSVHWLERMNEVKAYLGCQTELIRTWVLGGCNPDNSHVILLRWSLCAMMDGPANNSIVDCCNKLNVPEHSESLHPWKGVVVALIGQRMNHLWSHYQIARDINLGDYRTILNFFTLTSVTSLTREMSLQQRTQLYAPVPLRPSIQGVRICSDVVVDSRLQEICKYNIPRFQAVPIPVNHIIRGHIGLARGWPSPVADQRGIPLRIWPTGLVEWWNQWDGIQYKSNGVADCLVMSLHGNAFGWAPKDWIDRGDPNGVGDVLVVRADEGDISPEVVQGLYNFCKDVVHKQWLIALQELRQRCSAEDKLLPSRAEEEEMREGIRNLIRKDVSSAPKSGSDAQVKVEVKIEVE